MRVTYAFLRDKLQSSLTHHTCAHTLRWRWPHIFEHVDCDKWCLFLRDGCRTGVYQLQMNVFPCDAPRCMLQWYLVEKLCTTNAWCIIDIHVTLDDATFLDTNLHALYVSMCHIFGCVIYGDPRLWSSFGTKAAARQNKSCGRCTFWDRTEWHVSSRRFNVGEPFTHRHGWQ